jgi:hypothetical protein
VEDDRPDPGNAAMAEILDAAGDLRAIALFESDGTSGERLAGAWRIVSGLADDGRGASCLATENAVRCVEFAGYSRQHLIDVFAGERAGSIPAPAWVQRVLAIAAADPASSAQLHVDVRSDGSEPVLGVHEEGGVRFGVRREGRWRLSEPMSGGKVTAPFYFGSVDLTAAVGRPSIGIVVGGYIKEGCVRYETDELVVLEIGEELEELGRVLVGVAVWVATDDDRYGPFDPRDPSHYLIRLAPKVLPDGVVELSVAERHTPRKFSFDCTDESGREDVDDLLRLVGRHRIGDLLVRQEADQE